MALTLDSAGWTNLPLHPSARKIYVSDSFGDNSFDGLSEATPKKTVAAGFSLLRNNVGDQLVLERGSQFVFSSALSVSAGLGGLNADYPVVIGSYGTGPLPLIRVSGNESFLVANGNPIASNFAIVDLHIRGRDFDASTMPGAIGVLGPLNNLLIEGCIFERLNTPVVLQGFAGTILSPKVRRCSFLDNYSVNASHNAGIYIDGVSGVILEENFFDRSGHVPGAPFNNGPTIFRHNVYLQDNCSGSIVRNNYSFRPSAIGLSIRSPALIEGNIIGQASIGLGARGGDRPEATTIRNNIVVDSANNSGGGAQGWQYSLTTYTSAIVDNNIAIDHVERSGSANLGLTLENVSSTVISRMKLNRTKSNPDDFALMFVGGVSNGVSMINSYLQDTSSTRLLLADSNNGLTYTSGNSYYRRNGNNQWLDRLGEWRTVSAFNTLLNDTTSRSEQIDYIDSSRSPATFHSVIGGFASGLDNFISYLRYRERNNWDSRYDTSNVARWIFEGWEKRSITTDPIIFSSLTNSITNNGISWGFQNNVVAGQYINGDWWVLANTNNGVTINSITPNVVLGSSSVNVINGTPPWNAQWNDRNGSMVNPHWTKNRFQGVAEVGGAAGPDGKSPAYGFHGSATPTTDSKKLYAREANWALTKNGNTWSAVSPSNPKVLFVGESLVSCDSTVPNNAAPGNRTSIKKQAILTCVSSIPVFGSFRPGYSVDDATSYVTSADVNYAMLGNVEASTVIGLLPSSTYYSLFTSALKFPSLLYAAEGGNYAFAALDNLLCDGYGQSVATIQNTAIAYINTNALAFSDKGKLANYIIQRGIDCLAAIEQCYSTISTLGLPDWKFGGGGQMNSMKAPLIFLAGILKPGVFKTRVLTALNLCRDWAKARYPVFVEDAQAFTVEPINAFASQSSFRDTFPQYSSVSSILCYQVSDVGSIDWRMNINLPLNISPTIPGNVGIFETKGWSREEVQSTISALPGYNPQHVDLLWNPYRICCSVITWSPLAFAWKAMGIEKLLDNELYGRIVATYMQRQKFGPFAHAGGWLDSSINTLVTSGNTYGTLGSVSTRFGRELYETWVRNSMIGVSGAGTRDAARPVPGIESWGLPTNKNIVISVSGPFIAGRTTTVYCDGLAGFTNADFMNLYIATESQINDSYIDLFGAKLLLNNTVSVYPFTIPTGGSRASVNIPVISTARGQKFLLQAIIVKPVNGVLDIQSTNALKVTIQ